MGNRQSVLTKLRELTKLRDRDQDLKPSAEAITALKGKVNRLGPIPSDLTKDRRKFDRDLVNACADQVKQLEELSFKSGTRLEGKRQTLESEARSIYWHAVLPAIGVLFGRLRDSRKERSKQRFAREEFAYDSLHRDLGFVNDTAKPFDSFEPSLRSKVTAISGKGKTSGLVTPEHAIEQAKSLLAKVETDLLNEINSLVQRHPTLREKASSSSFKFAQPGSQSNVSVADTVSSLRRTGPSRPIESSWGIGA
jgi:hypothetical protein